MQRIQARCQETAGCLGLDPVLNQLPPEVIVKHAGTGKVNAYTTLYNFFVPIIDATRTLVAAYKPNRSFFASFEEPGRKALRTLIDHIHDNTEVPVILDAKEGDIGKSNRGYIDEAFLECRADALTLNPYLGDEDGLRPFFDRTEKAFFVLCRTSNKGGAELQNRTVSLSEAELADLFATHPALTLLEADRKVAPNMYHFKLYEIVAAQATYKWNRNGNIGLVVGGTAPAEGRRIRALAPYMFQLVPGFGAQGASVAETVPGIADTQGMGFIANTSSAALYAYQKPKYEGKTFVEATVAEVTAFRDDLNLHRFKLAGEVKK